MKTNEHNVPGDKMTDMIKAYGTLILSYQGSPPIKHLALVVEQIGLMNSLLRILPRSMTFRVLS